MHNPLLLRSAIIDDDIVESLKTLVIGDVPLVPQDLWRIELAIRAFVLAEDLRKVPHLQDQNVLREDYDCAPLGDGVLDYEFVPDSQWVKKLRPLSAAQMNVLQRTLVRALADRNGMNFAQLTLADIESIMRKIPPRFIESPVLALADRSGFFAERPDATDEDFNMCLRILGDDLLTGISMYGVALLRCEREGATVYSLSPVGEACHKYVFAPYPRQLFAGLDAKWDSLLKQVLGPGIGISVPPLFACILSRVEKRSDISSAIRDLRGEYDNSRKRLWDYLEEMWCAPTLKKQLKMLAKLEKASVHLFQAAFPERCRFLETAWSLTMDVANMKPLDAVGDIGKALLKQDEHVGAVSGIGFTRQLSSDIRNIAGLHTLLPKILSRAEQANFALL